MSADGTTQALQATASQTVGPYLHIGLAPRINDRIAFDDGADDASRIRIEGTVVDVDGIPMSDGMIEVWQADARGHYRHPHDARSGHAEPTRSAAGFGRVSTKADGGFRFTTIKPGRVPAPDGSLQAPHLLVAVFARGLLRHLSTRLYFADEAAANAEDAVLRRVPPGRRTTLLAAPTGSAAYRWPIVLQGDAETETVFFDY